MDQLGGLLLDGSYDLGMAYVRSRVTAIPAAKSRNSLPSTSSTRRAAAALGNHWIRARIAGRNEAVVVFDDAARIWAGQGW